MLKREHRRSEMAEFQRSTFNGDGIFSLQWKTLLSESGPMQLSALCRRAAANL